MTKARFIYITTKDREEALRIGRTVVTEGLAACANCLDGMTSVYQWQGQVVEDNEAVLILKTQQDAVPQLIERVKELHSYECPCVVSLAIEQGHAPYLHWLEANTKV